MSIEKALEELKSLPLESLTKLREIIEEIEEEKQCIKEETDY